MPAQWNIRVGLIFAQYDKSGRIDTDGDGENKGIVKYVEEGKFFDICGVNPDVGGWYNQSKEITVPLMKKMSILRLYCIPKML